MPPAAIAWSVLSPFPCGAFVVRRGRRLLGAGRGLGGRGRPRGPARRRPVAALARGAAGAFGAAPVRWRDGRGGVRRCSLVFFLWYNVTVR